MTTAVAPLVLRLPLTIPSQNVRDRWHWRGRHAEMLNWHLVLRAYVRASRTQLPAPVGKRRVHIVSIRRQRCRDDANLRGGAKGLVDAIVRTGLLRDDSDAFARITYAQETLQGRQPQTIVTVWPEGAP